MNTSVSIYVAPPRKTRTHCAAGLWTSCHHLRVLQGTLDMLVLRTLPFGPPIGTPDRQAYSAHHRRPAAGRARITVSGAPPTGAQRVDRRQVDAGRQRLETGILPTASLEAPWRAAVSPGYFETIRQRLLVAASSKSAAAISATSYCRTAKPSHCRERQPHWRAGQDRGPHLRRGGTVVAQFWHRPGGNPATSD